MLSKFLLPLVAVGLLPSCAAGVDISIPGEPGYTGLNFRYRGDSARPGSFLGPFEGTVRDKRAKYPVPKASVTAYYYFTIHGRPVATITKVVTTDANGRYFLPRLSQFPRYRVGLTLSHVDLFIQHKNYLPHLVSKHSSPFNQFQHVAYLNRDSETLKYTTLVERYLGAPDRGSSEVFHKAAEELVHQQRRHLDSASLLLPRQVKTMLGKPDLPKVGEFPARVEESGFTLTFKDGTRVTWIVWSQLTQQAQRRYTHYKKQLAEATPVPFDKDIAAVEGKNGESRVLLLNLKAAGTVLLLACRGTSSCTRSAMKRLAHSALKRKSMLIFMEDWNND